MWQASADSYPDNLCVLSLHGQVKRCLQVNILNVHISITLQQLFNFKI